MKNIYDLFDPPPFHNTIAATGSTLHKNTQDGLKQEDRILAYFQEVKRSTALQVAERLGLHEASARRAVTNLFHRGKLTKTTEQVIEKYGKPNYIYQLA